MKNAKKLLLAVLSLVLLVGVFAFAAFAEDAPAAATITYPDGSTDTVAVGSVIVPKEFTTETRTENMKTGVDEEGNPVIEVITITDRLYYGANNTLFKDDATEGWIFTLEGTDTALEDLTVTEEMAGKKIIASGLDQVYSVINVTLPSGDYYKWMEGQSSTTVKFVKAGEIYTTSAGTTIQTTKRVAGTYKVYFYDAASLEKYFSKAASIELGGVTLNYQDLRGGSSAKHNVKLYADHTMGNLFTWADNGYDRPNTSDKTGVSATSSGGSAVVNFDLNGHAFINTDTSNYMNVRAMSLYFYSSQPGAHFFKEKSTAFHVNDDAQLCIGNSSSTGKYSDNLHVHVKTLFSNLNSGAGAYIWGGHYYQTDATTTYLVHISGRVNVIKNASFYVKNGVAVFGDPTSLNGGSNNKISKAKETITNCKFYTDGTSPILKVSKTVTESSVAASIKLQDCTFYGVSTKKADTNATEANQATITLVSGNIEKEAIVYNTVTFFDGTTDFYYVKDREEAEALEAAKAFVEGHPSSKPAILPYGIASGKELYCILNPVKEIVYEDDFNARVIATGEPVKVAYTLTINGKTSYITDKTKLNSYLGAMDYGVKITLYEDISVSTNFISGRKSMDKTSSGEYVAMSTFYGLDLNGFTLTMTTSSTITSHANAFYLYSSTPGGKLLAKNAPTFYTNNADYKVIDGVSYGNQEKPYKDATDIKPNKPTGSIFFGEASAPTEATAGPYGKNLTVVCQSLTGSLYGNTIHIWGGTFVQAEKSNVAAFISFTNRTSYAWHANFVITNAKTSPVNFYNTSNRTFVDCSFIYEGGAPIAISALAKRSTSSSDKAGDTHTKFSAFTFKKCSFYDIDAYHSYTYEYTHTDMNKEVFTGADTIAATYTNCYFGFSGLMPTNDRDPGDGVSYLAHSKTTKTVTANEKDFVIDGAFISDLSNALILTHEDLGTEYFSVGAIVSPYTTDKYRIEDDVFFEAAYDYSGIANIDSITGAVTSAGEAEVTFVYNEKGVLAFTYRDLATDALYIMLYADCGETDAGVGEKFHALFSEPDAGYEIVMYQNMTLSKAVPFGKYIVSTEKIGTATYNTSYYNTLSTGSIIWDLNGTTVTIASNVSGLVNLTNANAMQNAENPGSEVWVGNTVFGFEGYNTENSFTLKSSIEGGKIVNESSAHLFGIGEGKRTKIVFDGENLTIISPKGLIINAQELLYDITKDCVCVNGGTYISGHSDGVFKVSMYATIENATIVSTASQTANIISIDGYRSGAIKLNNVTFIAENPAVLAFNEIYGSKEYTVSVKDCTFVNCILTTKASIAASYTGANLASIQSVLDTMHPDSAGKTLAYSNVIYEQAAYKVMGYYSTGYALVNWGFGITENWLIGQTAAHDITIVDEIFAYEFAEITVSENENNATATLVAIRPGAMQMSLTLQSQIGMNLMLNPAALEKATVTLNGETYVLANLEKVNGIYVLKAAIKPNEANQPISLVIEINGYAHTIPVSVGTYAEAVLASNSTEKVKNLTYSMIEYVRAMTKDETFCNVEIPDSYRRLLTAEEYVKAEENAILTGIRFRLAETIAIEVAAAAATEEEVNLILAKGRSERANLKPTILDEETVYTAIFEGLYVNEFFGDITILVGGETYTYNLANYYHEMQDGDEKAVIEALYNYAYHAQEYVDSITPAAN